MIAGSLPRIEIVASLTNTIVYVFEGMQHFHNKAIQTACWYPGSDTMFFSGGWDSSVKFWNLELKKAVTKIYGVQVTGDSVAMHADCNIVAIGGSSAEEGIMIYDLRSPGAPTRLICYGLDENDMPYNAKVNSIKFIP